jgi:hypothetical protein
MKLNLVSVLFSRISLNLLHVTLRFSLSPSFTYSNIWTNISVGKFRTLISIRGKFTCTYKQFFQYNGCDVTYIYLPQNYRHEISRHANPDTDVSYFTIIMPSPSLQLWPPRRQKKRSCCHLYSRPNRYNRATASAEITVGKKVCYHITNLGVLRWRAINNFATLIPCTIEVLTQVYLGGGGVF